MLCTLRELVDLSNREAGLLVCCARKSARHNLNRTPLQGDFVTSRLGELSGKPPDNHRVRSRVGLFDRRLALPGVIEMTGEEATMWTLCHESARGPGERYYRNHCVALERRLGVHEPFVSVPVVGHFAIFWERVAILS